MLPHLKKRMFYSPRVKPEKRYTEDDLTSAFCGASDVWDSRLAAQVHEYATEVWSLHETEESIEPEERRSLEIDTYEYWSNKRRDGKWPQLVPVALFWISFETSSIIAERAFAILRTIEAPMRHRQLVANWVRELRFRVMKKTVAALLEEALAKVQ